MNDDPSIVSVYPTPNFPQRYEQLVTMLLSETKGVIRSYFNSCSKIVSIDTYLKEEYYDDCPTTTILFDKAKAKIKFLELLSSIKGTKELIDKLNDGYQVLKSKSKELSNNHPNRKLKDISSKINQFKKIYEATHETIIDLIGNNIIYWCRR